MLRRILIRLYPRHWRDRYGEEFARLLEDMPLSIGMIANVIGAAMHEWLVRTVIGRAAMGPMLAYAALLCAQLLSVVAGAQPTFSYEAGLTVVTPSWPVSLGFVHPLVGFAVLARVVLGVLRDLKVGDGEFTFWTLSLFVGAVAQQWALLEMNVGTGIAPWSPWTLWSYASVSIVSNLMFLFIGSRGLPQRSPYRSSVRPSDRPLGLA